MLTASRAEQSATSAVRMPFGRGFQFGRGCSQRENAANSGMCWNIRIEIRNRSGTIPKATPVPERKGHIMRPKKIKLAAGLLSLALAVAAATAQAQNQPSAKVTAKTANLTLLPKTSRTGDWQTLLANN